VVLSERVAPNKWCYAFSACRNLRGKLSTKVSIHVTVEETLGMAVAKPDASACRVSRRGEVFAFDIISQLTITSTEPV
jgi:hypothetical protein